MLKKPTARFSMLALSLFSVLMLLLSACGATGTPTGSGGSGSNSGTPVKGGIWVDDIPNEPDSLLGNGSSQTFSSLVDQSLYLPLFVGDYNGNITPGAATTVPTLANGGISSDFKTYTIHMRPGLKWSDGQPYNGDDVAFTINLWNNPKYGAASTLGYNLVTSTDVSSDKLTVTFHLKQAFAPFVSAWTDGLAAPLPKHHFASMDPATILKSPDNLNPSVTSGPFMMSESKPGDHYTVVRNPNYYLASQGLPYLDKIVYDAVGDENTIYKNLQAGSITSSWFLDVSKTNQYKQLSNYKVYVNPNASNYEVMIFNLKNPALKDVNVRKAMAMAIDHNALIKTARLGQAKPLCTDHGESLHPGYQADAPCPKFDPAAANALLDQSGWVKGSDGVRAKNGQRLEFHYATTTGKPWRAADELILQSNFKDIGIKLDIQNYPASTFFGTFMPNGKHDLAEFENSYTYDPDDASVMACNQQGTNGENWSFYCNPQMDQLLNQEEATVDPNARQQVFNQIHQIELTDFPFAILYSPLDLAVAKTTAHNYGPGPEGASETIGVDKWWCEGGKC
jgi:peptide/nickel transport system substrate-binding protein